MNLKDFPKDIKNFLIPKKRDGIIYKCLACGNKEDIKKLLYVCPKCGSVLLLEDEKKKLNQKISGKTWQKIFNYRKMLNVPELKGIFRYYEFIAPVIPLNSIVYLGEAHTPIIKANDLMQKTIGMSFYFKNDGQNPSASFKDRGMASALSYVNFLSKQNKGKEILSICASTGDTSASAALYASYLSGIKSAVLLPHKQITPQQLSQPLGSGAKVFEIIGVFDDCMKVVENLSQKYEVALLNSKNAWRILGQESYSYEIAQDFEFDLKNKVIVVPIGNAGNITAILSGFLKFYEANIINTLPKVIGVQSEHANPVFRYYSKKLKEFQPVKVKPSVAQAAMIGNPVSMPRVIKLVKDYNLKAKKENVFFVDVKEQDIMDYNILANQNGHIACTQGAEGLAGLKKALKNKFVKKDEIAIIDSTAHSLKFSNFQTAYFENTLPKDFEIIPKKDKINLPTLVQTNPKIKTKQDTQALDDKSYKKYIEETALNIAKLLNLK